MTRVTSRRFQFLHEIASGTFGSVFLAKEMHTDGFSRLVAVKLLHRRWSESQEVAQRMRDEARLLGWLRHRNIVDVVDLTSIDGRAAVIMEYLEAVDLKGLIDDARDRDATIPLRAGLQICAFTAGALDAAYNRPPYAGEKPLRVIHRDIKPSNIMVDEAGVVKVLDFGVARADFESRESSTRELQFGSVDYMPPERLFFEPETPASDVYSLGATLYELLALERLGKAKGRPDKHAVFIRDRLSFLRAMRGLKGDWVGELEELFIRMLAYDHTERIAAAELATTCRELARRIDDEGLYDWAEEHIPPILVGLQDRPHPEHPLSGHILVEDSQLLVKPEEPLPRTTNVRIQTEPPPPREPSPLPRGHEDGAPLPPERTGPSDMRSRGRGRRTDSSIRSSSSGPEVSRPPPAPAERREPAGPPPPPPEPTDEAPLLREPDDPPPEDAPVLTDPAGFKPFYASGSPPGAERRRRTARPRGSRSAPPGGEEDPTPLPPGSDVFPLPEEVRPRRDERSESQESFDRRSSGARSAQPPSVAPGRDRAEHALPATPSTEQLPTASPEAHPAPADTRSTDLPPKPKTPAGTEPGEPAPDPGAGPGGRPASQPSREPAATGAESGDVSPVPARTGSGPPTPPASAADTAAPRPDPTGSGEPASPSPPEPLSQGASPPSPSARQDEHITHVFPTGDLKSLREQALAEAGEEEPELELDDEEERTDPVAAPAQPQPDAPVFEPPSPGHRPTGPAQVRIPPERSAPEPASEIQSPPPPPMARSLSPPAPTTRSVPSPTEGSAPLQPLDVARHRRGLGGKWAAVMLVLAPILGTLSGAIVFLLPHARISFASVPAAPPPEAAPPASGVPAPAATSESPAAPDGNTRFVSMADNTRKLQVRCTGVSGRGESTVSLTLEESETCTVTAILRDRSRMMAVVDPALPGVWTCFAQGANRCEREPDP